MNEEQEPVQHFVLNAETGFLEVKLTQPVNPPKPPDSEESEDVDVQ